VSGLILPSSECGLPVSLNLNVTISNFGTLVQTGFPVSYQINNLPIVTQNFSGNLASGASSSFSFTQPVDLSISDVVTLKIWTSLIGDQLQLNDTLIKNLNLPPSIVALCDFNNYNGDNISEVQAGWTERTGFPPTGNTSNWLSSTVSQSTTLGSTSARMGFFANTRKEWLISPVLSPVQDSKLNVSIAVTNRSSSASDIMGSDDSLNIMVTTNCGLTWTRIKSFTVADQIGNQLTNQAISLSDFVGQRIQIGFFATEGAIDNTQDYDFHLDNVYVAINTSNNESFTTDQTILFPNPAKEYFNIQLDRNDPFISNLEMYSSDGKSVKPKIDIQDGTQIKRINILNLPEGLYFVRFVQSGKRIVKSISVKH
jgi:hypothetical protein